MSSLQIQAQKELKMVGSQKWADIADHEKQTEITDEWQMVQKKKSHKKQIRLTGHKPITRASSHSSQ